MFQEFLGSRGAFQDVQKLPYPAVLAPVHPACALLVDPVRGDAVFRDLVHLAGADLHFDALPFGPEHARMQGAVAVGFGRADVILEAIRDDRVGTVDHTQRSVTLLHGVDDDAETHDVRELLEAHFLVPHLPPDRVRRLFAPDDRGLDPGFGQGGPQLRDDAGHQVAALFTQETQACQDGIADIGVDLGEGQVLELVFHSLHADPRGQRRVDIHGLGCDPPPLLGVFDVVKGAHVVQAVGQFDQQDPDVFGHGQDQLAEVLGLGRVVRLKLDAGQLGDAVHQARHLLAEVVFDLLQGGRGVLDGVVKERRDDRRGVQLIRGQNPRHLQGMGEIGIARGPFLHAVGLHGENIGAVKGVLVGAWIVRLDLFEQFELPDHVRPCRPSTDT